MKKAFFKKVIQKTGRKIGVIKSPEKKLFFLHIPKCGGNSVSDALRDLYSGKEAWSITPMASQSAAQLLNIEWRDETECLQAYYMFSEKIKLITGHFMWSEKLYEAFKNDWIYLTILRDPIERWISNYFYDRYKTHSNFKRIDLAIDEFLRTDRAKIMGSNLVRFLSGHSDDDELAIKVAKSNLQKFDIVGFTDDIKSLEKDMAYNLNHRFKIPHINKNPRKDLADNVAKNRDMLKRITELCLPDIEVYEYAKKHYYDPLT